MIARKKTEAAIFIIGPGEVSRVGGERRPHSQNVREHGCSPQHRGPGLGTVWSQVSAGDVPLSPLPWPSWDSSTAMPAPAPSTFQPPAQALMGAAARRCPAGWFTLPGTVQQRERRGISGGGRENGGTSARPCSAAFLNL